MTEAEWLTSHVSWDMLAVVSHRLSDRKARLFGCACLRLFAPVAPHVCRFLDLVEAAADWDPPAGQGSLAAASRAVSCHIHNARSDEALPGGEYYLWQSVQLLLHDDPARSIRTFLGGTDLAGQSDRFASVWLRPDQGNRPPSLMTRFQADMVRELFANPCDAIFVDPSWGACNDRIVVRLAEAIYGEHGFDRLPILADALEDAGCSDAQLLGHLRGPGPHVRGCFALDLLLGKS
jgi:hypothetical protein